MKYFSITIFIVALCLIFNYLIDGSFYKSTDVGSRSNVISPILNTSIKAKDGAHEVSNKLSGERLSFMPGKLESSNNFENRDQTVFKDEDLAIVESREFEELYGVDEIISKMNETSMPVMWTSSYFDKLLDRYDRKRFETLMFLSGTQKVKTRIHLIKDSGSQFSTYLHLFIKDKQICSNYYNSSEESPWRLSSDGVMQIEKVKCDTNFIYSACKIKVFLLSDPKIVGSILFCASKASGQQYKFINKSILKLTGG